MIKLPKAGICMMAAAVLLALSVSSWAAEAPVFVTAARNSFSNRTPLSPGVALTSSSVLRTLSDGSVSLRVGEGQVNLGHRTQLNVQGNTLALSHGYVQVEGAVAVRQAGHALLPSSAQAEYEVVALNDGTTYLHVIRGQVRVTGFAHPAVVAAGHAVAFQKGVTGEAAGTASADAAAKAAEAAHFGLGLGVLAAVAGTLATILVVHAATTSSSTSSSPSQP
jgi:hypothetical protein